MKAFIIIVLLAGCAQLPEGVAMTDDERKACAASQDCSVWTVAELQKLIRAAMQRGFDAGKRLKWDSI